MRYINYSGNKAAADIAREAAKGAVLGLFLAFGYKIAIMDPAKNQIDNYYKGIGSK